MTGSNWKRYAIAIFPLMVSSSMVFAERAGFYTIIGPDGRVMVIDRNAAASTKPAKDTKDSAQGEVVQKTAPSLATPVEPASLQQPKPVANVLQQQQSGMAAAKPIAQPMPPVVVSFPKVDTKSKDGGKLPAVKSQAGVNQAVASHPALPVVPAISSVSQPNAGITATKQPAASPSPGINQPASVTAAQAASPAVKTSDAPAEQQQGPVTTIDGVQYIQSEYLEQKEFNLDGKKRFYSLPDGLGGKQVLQREKGVDMNVFKGPQVELPKVVTLSKDYQRIDAKQVVDLIGMSCFSEKQLEKAKPLKEKATLDFWPRPSFEPKFDFVVARFESDISDIELTSYATTMRNPLFYWPLPIFLDKNACVLEGVNAFYQRTLDATAMQHQAVQGFLHVPQGARYLLLTPLEVAADLSQMKLTNKGQVRLTPIR